MTAKFQDIEEFKVIINNDAKLYNYREIMEKAREFAKSRDHKFLPTSAGWAERMCKKHGIKCKALDVQYGRYHTTIEIESSEDERAMDIN